MTAQIPTDSEELDFNRMPLEHQNRLLACHLKTHIQMVDDMTDDNRILYERLKKRNKELENTRLTLATRNKQCSAHWEFLRRHGLTTAFEKFAALYEQEGGEG